MVICFVYYCYTATYLIVDNVCSAVPKSRYKNNIAVLIIIPLLFIMWIWYAMFTFIFIYE